ncbi:MAG: DUF4230 domain-containing protein [Cyclobacteriaceae bacterium]|uniref:DUF4230 domain-containing protein n=1 Tax=Nonlabens ulvanivorans TaxID=906888 RepID=UPI003295B713
MRIPILLIVLILISSCKKEDDQRYLVVSKIKNSAKLATTETVIDKVVLGTQERKLLGLIRVNKAHFAAYTQAIITAGIDLSKLEPNDIEISDKRIEIALPNVEVLDFSYPFSKYKIDSTITRDKFLNSITILDHEQFYMDAELEIRNNLKYTGIKRATEEKTRILIAGMLKNLGYEEIYITFKPGVFIEEIYAEESLEEKKK